MRRVVHWVFAGMGAFLGALPVAAEPTASPPGAKAEASVDEERAFAVEAARYERLREFTQKLVREREQRAFEESAEHYSRLSGLTRSLAEAAAAAQQREFDAEVELYVKKRNLTRELSEENALRSRATSAPSSEPSSSVGTSAAPSW